MKKKLLIVITIIFLSGCYKTINKTEKNVEVEGISKDSSTAIKKALIIFDNTYRLVYNNSQEKNEVDKKAMDEAKPLLIENFEIVKYKIDKSKKINILPLSYSLITNQSGKHLSLNLFIINTSNDKIVNFRANENFSFSNNPYSFSDTLEMKDIGMENLSPNEGVIYSYEQNITDQPEEYFNNLKLKDININLSELEI
ncbi:hypothetical protein BFC22_10115 [Carnobacterium divergens]|uniref:hypothetical protein n=1 Tax=Carnobacterium divergens TaxID=2748 RepID=UPI00054F7FCA|nr:hypothetical protein [Carnobacterium divergens]AOA00447.1 hypothetical protein BFC22_10115 [Carnobacterium divergens]MDO0874324.1 hypothetical protein [Carnobacterium divergens]SUX21435.1 Uncharacterised protein [Carnobacterium divergens]